MKKIYTLLCCMLFGLTVQSQTAGTLDSTFNTNGKYTFDFGFQDNLNDVTLQHDEKIVCTGVALTPAFAGVLKVIRLNTDGTPDTDFGANGVFSFLVGQESYGYESYVRTDGKIMVVGITYDANYNADWLLLRLNSNGTLDSTFGNNGVTIFDFFGRDDLAQAITLQPNNKIIVTGTATDTINFYNQPVIARFNENGTIDSSFGTNGIVTFPATAIDNEVTSVSIQQDGKIVAAGHYENTFTGSSDFDIMVLRVDSNGVPDATFGANGFVKTPINDGIDDSFGMDIDTDGNIVVAGFTTLPFTLTLDMVLLKYDHTGTLDPNFGTGGIVTFNNADEDVATDLKIQPDNKIVVGGSSGLPFLGPRDFAVWRYLPNGTADATFGSNGFVTTTVLPNFQDCNAIVLQNDGKIVAAGRANNANNNDIAVVRYLTNVATAINEVNVDEALSAFPNPVAAGDFISINSPTTAVTQIMLYDISGKEILAQHNSVIDKNNFQLQIPPSINTGVYFLIVQTNNKILRSKIVVLR